MSTPFNANGPQKRIDSDPIGTAVGAQRTQRVTSQQVAFLLAAVARIPDVFLAARFQLTPELFEPGEAHFVLVTKSIFAAADGNRGMIPREAAVARELICLKCSAEIESDKARMYYTPTVERRVMDDGGLLDMIFAMPVSQEVAAESMSLLRQFMTERKVADPVMRALAGIESNSTLKDPASLMTIIDAHARDVAGIGVDAGSDAIVDEVDFRPEGAKLVSTKIDWLDELMNGGHAAGEAYVVLGVTGAGKSSLATQIAMEGAELQALIAAEVGPLEAGYWYYFSYELSTDEMRERCYSYGAKVHHETFHIKPRRPLSTAEIPESLHPYEHDPVINSPGNPLMGERERMAALNMRQSGANNRLKIVDYSGKVEGQGMGGVEEIASYLKRENMRGRKIAGIVIDYAGLAVNRLIGHRRLRPDAEYPLLSQFVDQVRNQVSIPLACPAWVLHQFHGDVNKKAPGAKVSHSEARGSRNFADNCDFAFGFAGYNKATGLMTVTMSKHRRAAGREDDTIVRFDGRIGTFSRPDQDYVIDPQTRQIVPRNYLDSIPVRQNRGGLPPVNPLDGMS